MTASMISRTDEFVTCVLRRDRPARVAEPDRKRREADREEDAQRAEERHDLQDDDEELGAVAGEPDLRRADALPGIGRLERHVVPGLDERQRRRRRRREPVRQQVEELAQALAAGAAKPRRQVRNVPAGEIAGKPVEHRVAGPPRGRRLGGRPPRANHEVVLPEARDDSARILGPMLSIAVDDHDELAGGAADAALHRGAVALVVRVPARPPRQRLPHAPPLHRVEPSSTTMISRHGPAAARSVTTSPIPAASLKAGTTTETADGSAT